MPNSTQSDTPAARTPTPIETLRGIVEVYDLTSETPHIEDILCSNEWHSLLSRAREIVDAETHEGVAGEAREELAQIIGETIEVAVQSPTVIHAGLIYGAADRCAALLAEPRGVAGEAPPLPVDALNQALEWLDNDGNEMADDAIVKLADAKCKPFAHVTAEWLRQLITATSGGDHTPDAIRGAEAPRGRGTDVRPWIEAVLAHYPVGWVFDPTQPRLMVDNLIRARDTPPPQTYLTADATPAAEPDQGVIDQLVTALRRQHQWHLAQTEPDDEFGYVPADEYSDSDMCEQTMAALEAAADSAAEPDAGGDARAEHDLAEWVLMYDRAVAEGTDADAVYMDMVRCARALRSAPPSEPIGWIVRYPQYPPRDDREWGEWTFWETRPHHPKAEGKFQQERVYRAARTGSTAQEGGT